VVKGSILMRLLGSVSSVGIRRIRDIVQFYIGNSWFCSGG